ncbi:MAG TPA: hypothetical protein VFC38_09175 [Stellaceae bacterium]|nr:hypothetical protein [Stellaceae bacterium]
MPSRWLQLIIGIIGIATFAALQPGWALFVHPMSAAHGRAVSTATLSLLSTATGASIMNFIVVALALVALKPLRARRIANLARGVPAE